MTLEPGWLAKALEAASERAKDLPYWLKREPSPDPQNRVSQQKRKTT